MALRFRVLALESSPADERALELDESLTEIRFGRRAGLEVTLPFPALALVHARMVRDGSGWRVEDLGGDGGSWLDGRRLAAGAQDPMTLGQTLRLAHVSIVFEGTAPSDRAAEGTGTISRRLVNDLLGAVDQEPVPRLLTAGGAEALRLAVSDRTYVIGRGETCDLILQAEDISREHATLARRGEGVHIRDLGSKNGVRVAGQPIDGERRLRDGQRVEVGSVEFQLDDPEDRYLRQLEETSGAPAIVPRAPHAASPPSAPGSRDPGDSRRRGAGIAIFVAATVLVAIAGLAIALVLAS